MSFEQRGVVTKRRVNRDGTPSKRRIDQDVSDAMMVLRDAALVPWDWLVDETRSLFRWDYGETVADAVRAGLDEARLDLWSGEPPPLVLTESRSLAGVLRSVAADYLCPIAATNGQVGGFLHTTIAPLLGDARVVLYLGDLDHQGGQIEANTRAVLERIVERSIPWRRVAITPTQARGIEPILKPDHRYRPHRYHDAWETEALGQGAVVAILRAALDALAPEPIEDVLVREADQRAAVARLLDDA